ncbi:hypothetical protein IP88_10880 [alpha proteobacterium AAP81b]|nr:hypothetical protein IP88_10880 [alpha proteobacterium AAP81b]
MSAGVSPEFSRPLPSAELGSALRHYDLVADAAERAALAKRLGLLALDTLTAAFDLAREPAGIRVAGRFHAAGSQPCVATAEPVAFEHDEPIALLLTETLPGAEEIELAAADLDSEPLLNGIIDLGELAAQALGVALDPYPRSGLPAPGVVSEEAARVAASPFAVLKK